jgi:hypothetical protein
MEEEKMYIPQSHTLCLLFGRRGHDMGRSGASKRFSFSVEMNEGRVP